jgi:hypothetical protein
MLFQSVVVDVDVVVLCCVAEMYLKDTRYACGYWQEHRGNFAGMIMDVCLLVRSSTHEP